MIRAFTIISKLIVNYLYVLKLFPDYEKNNIE